MLLLTQIIFLSIWLMLSWFGLKLLLIKFQLHRNENELLYSYGIHPAGSTITHGMIRTNPGKRGVTSVQEPSLKWYTRLFEQ